MIRMEWEKPYLDALIDELRPFGEVLEVGFALGISSKRIQTFNPKHHTIIESDPKIAAKAATWADGNPNISVVQSNWQTALATLGRFDSIFFNEFSGGIEQEKALKIVQKGDQLVSKIQEEFPQLASLRYSDTDIYEFFCKVEPFQREQMSQFLHELRENSYITDEQYQKFVDKYLLEKKICKKIEKHPDEMMLFLKACLKKHMRKGSRFSAVCNCPISKYEIPEFFETIITSPHFEYQEKHISIEVSKSCAFYPYKEALVMALERL